jgi:formate/nitrite transporter
MAWVSGRVTLGQLLRNWTLVYIGNLLGAILTAVFVFYSAQYAMDSYKVGANALSIANSKVNLDWIAAFTRGVLCNALVCLAVWLCYSARSTTDKILAIIPPITAFVASSFEHSIANMYYIPLGIFVSSVPEVLAAAGKTTADLANLTWYGFVINNLIPVTLGNVIGGSVLVGGIYWVAYLRGKHVLPPQLSMSLSAPEPDKSSVRAGGAN